MDLIDLLQFFRPQTPTSARSFLQTLIYKKTIFDDGRDEDFYQKPIFVFRKTDTSSSVTRCLDYF